MAITKEDVRIEVADGENIPDATIDSQIEIAEVITQNQFGLEATNPLYDILQMYYVLHLLYIKGFTFRLTGFSIGDHSQSFESLSMGEKEGNSPFLIEFKRLSGGANDFPVSI